MRTLATVLLGALAITAVQSVQGQTNPVGDAESPEDAALQAEITDRLSRAVIGQDGFQFTVRKGVVYWTGETDVAQHKGAATRMARSAGAKQVVNRIIVKSSRGTEKRSRSTTRQPRPQQINEPTHVRPAIVRWRTTQRH